MLFCSLILWALFIYLFGIFAFSETRSCSVAQAGLELTRNSPALASQMLKWQVCVGHHKQHWELPLAHLLVFNPPAFGCVTVPNGRSKPSSYSPGLHASLRTWSAFNWERKKNKTLGETRSLHNTAMYLAVFVCVGLGSISMLRAVGASVLHMTLISGGYVTTCLCNPHECPSSPAYHLQHT